MEDKTFFFNYKHIFLYGAVVSLSLYYPKLCDRLKGISVNSITIIKQGQSTVYQQ